MSLRDSERRIGLLTVDRPLQSCKSRPTTHPETTHELEHNFPPLFYYTSYFSFFRFGFHVFSPNLGSSDANCLPKAKVRRPEAAVGEGHEIQDRQHSVGGVLSMRNIELFVDCEEKEK